MKKGMIIGIILIVIGVVGYFVLLPTKITSEKEVIKIGAVLPLTGDLGNPGNRILNGILLAKEEVDTSKFSIKLYPEDSKSNSTESSKAIMKLIDFNKVSFVIGGMLSSTTITMNKIANTKQIILISPTASSPYLSKAGDYFFRVWPSDKSDAEISAKYCFNELSLESMAIVYWNNDYGVGLKDQFMEVFQALGGKIIKTFGYGNDISDFKTIINNLKQENIKGVYLPGIPPTNALLIKQAKELNLNAIFFSNLSAQEADFRKLAGDAIEGVYFTNLNIDPNLFNNSEFFNTYVSRFDESPDIQSLKGYESMKLILESVSNGYSTPKAFMKFIDSVGTFNFFSDTLQFSKTGDAKVKYSINKYIAGEIVTITTAIY